MTGNKTDSGLSYMRDKAAIAGIGETEFSFDSGRTEWQLACEAIKAACDDAGISPHEIDGLFRQDAENNDENLIVSGLGLQNIRHWESSTYGGGGATATVAHAAAAIAVGYCDVAVCWRAANDRSGVIRRGQSRGSEGIPGGAQSFSTPFGSMAAAHSFGGMFTRRYMHEYGANKKDKYGIKNTVVSKNIFEAIKWYKRAAKQKHAKAAKKLGDIYWQGKHVTEDYEEALKWYKIRQINENFPDISGRIEELETIISQTPFGKAKKRCRSLGFKEGTPKFGDCVVKLYKN